MSEKASREFLKALREMINLQAEMSAQMSLPTEHLRPKFRWSEDIEQDMAEAAQLMRYADPMTWAVDELEKWAEVGLDGR